MGIRRKMILLGGLIAAVVVASGSLGVGWAMHRSPPTDAAIGTTDPRLLSTQADAQIAKLQTRLKQSPNDWKAANDLGDAYLQKARETGDPTWYAKAEAVLQESLKMKPDNFNAMTSLGSLSLSRHQFRDALGWGERAKALNPTQARIYGVIGDAEIELGQYPEAVSTFQAMVNLRPDLSSYARVSYARELYGDLDGAIDAMQKAIVASGPYPENSAYLRVQLSGLFFTKGDLATAEQQASRALSEAPGYAPALAGQAKVDAAKGNLLVAIGRYQQAVDRMPLPEYVIALGDAQEAAGKTQEAARSFDLARVQERLYAANGVDVDVELALFDADHQTDPPGTVALARSALERRPSIKASDALAWALSQSGDDQSAQPIMQQALRLGTQDPLMLFHAGMIAYHLGDHAAARTYLERVMALNPHFSVRYAPLAQQTLTTLRAGG
jgi:tetratricopeptide (TPR) repeat protein